MGASSFLGSAAAQVNADTVVDLGQEGLSSGDNIDPYLEEHFQSGTEVHIPAGEYNYSGDGLGGDYSDAALIGSPEGVVFHRPDDPEVEVRPTMWAESGTVRIENITVRGKRGEAQSRWRVGAAEGARFEVVNVNLPDGTVDPSDSTGIYSGTDHAGTLWVKSCFFSNFGNVALYVSDPYQGGNGRVIVEDCDFVNTGMSALRFAPSGSECRRCYFEATERAPADNTGWNQRGIKIDDPGTDVLIEDCDFNWSDVGAMAINFDDEGEGGTGTMRNLRIYNDGGTTFVDEWGTEGNWAGENIHLTGQADHNAPSHFATVTGSEAESPNTDYKIWTPVDANVTDDSTTSGADGGSTDSGSTDDGTSDGSSTDRTILIEASPDNPDTYLDVSFTTTGPIEFGSEAESGTDTIAQNEDGTYTATSVEMNPAALDSYNFAGEVVDYSVTEGYELARVEVDGQQTTFEDLVAGSSDGSGDSDSTDTSSDSSDGGSSDDGSSNDSSSGGGSTGGTAKTHHILIEASPDNPDTYLDVSFTTTGPIEFAGEAESGTDVIAQNEDGTYTATSVEMNPAALDSYDFTGEVVDYSVTEGYELARVEVDGQQTTFEDLVAESSDGSGDSDSTDTSSDSSDGGSSDDGSSNDSTSSDDGTSERVIVIDGTGDAEEIARYEIAVTGTLERDEERSMVADDSAPWDRMTDYVGESRAAGLVGNGKDAYRFTGEITTQNIKGKAGVTVLGE